MALVFCKAKPSYLFFLFHPFLLLQALTTNYLWLFGTFIFFPTGSYETLISPFYLIIKKYFILDSLHVSFSYFIFNLYTLNRLFLTAFYLNPGQSEFLHLLFIYSINIYGAHLMCYILGTGNILVKNS